MNVLYVLVKCIPLHREQEDTKFQSNLILAITHVTCVWTLFAMQEI